MKVGAESVTSAAEVAMKLSEADAKVRALHTQIELIGSEEEKLAAGPLRDAVWNFTSAYARLMESDEAAREARHAAFEESHNEYLDARRRFRETVRKGLTS